MIFACPHCQQHLEADDSFVGNTVHCPMCGKPFVAKAAQTLEIPAPSAPTPATPAPVPPPLPTEPPKAAPKFRVVSRPQPVVEAPTAAPKFHVVSRSQPTVNAKGQDTDSSRTNEAKVSPNFRVVSRPQDAVPETPNPAGFRARSRTPDEEESSRGSKRWKCPHCGVGLETDEPIEGTRVSCPECNGEFIAAPPRTAKSKGQSSKLVAVCPHCTRCHDLPPSAAGTYVDCRACGKRFRVTEPSSTEATPGLSVMPTLVSWCIMFAAIVIFWGVIALGVEWESVAIGALAVVMVAAGLLGTISACVLHYRCWEAIPEKFARTPAGKAVRYLFIPGFDLYWLFPSFAGLGADCAMLAQRKGFDGFSNLKTLGRVYAVTALCGCFLMPVSTVSMILCTIVHLVVWVLFYRGVTQLLNRLAQTGGCTPSTSIPPQSSRAPGGINRAIVIPLVLLGVIACFWCLVNAQHARSPEQNGLPLLKIGLRAASPLGIAAEIQKNLNHYHSGDGLFSADGHRKSEAALGLNTAGRALAYAPSNYLVLPLVFGLQGAGLFVQELADGKQRAADDAWRAAGVNPFRDTAVYNFDAPEQQLWP